MNQELSENRAGAVRDYLVQQGVATNSVSAKGLVAPPGRTAAEQESRISRIRRCDRQSSQRNRRTPAVASKWKRPHSVSEGCHTAFPSRLLRPLSHSRSSIARISLSPKIHSLLSTAQQPLQAYDQNSSSNHRLSPSAVYCFAPDEHLSSKQQGDWSRYGPFSQI
jgi:hypothetical protein